MKLYSPYELVKAALTENGILGEDRPPKRIKIGLPFVEAEVGGLSPGNFMVLGAYTNVGKTTTLLHMAYNVQKHGGKSGYISLEDDQILIGERIQAFFSHISAKETHLAGHARRDDVAYSKALALSKNLDMPLYFPPENSLKEVLEGVRALAARGCDVVMIDYFTAIMNDSSQDGRLGYNKMLVKLRNLAQELRLAIVLASQIKRPEDRVNAEGVWQESEPTVKNLSETSFLEHKADVIVLMWKNREGDTFARLEKLKYSRGNQPTFNVWMNPGTGLLQFNLVKTQADEAFESADSSDETSPKIDVKPKNELPYLVTNKRTVEPLIGVPVQKPRGTEERMLSPIASPAPPVSANEEMTI